MPGPSKQVCYVDKDFKETILQWLNEEGNNVSDFESTLTMNL